MSKLQGETPEHNKVCPRCHEALVYHKPGRTDGGHHYPGGWGHVYSFSTFLAVVGTAKFCDYTTEDDPTGAD